MMRSHKIVEKLFAKHSVSAIRAQFNSLLLQLCAARGIHEEARARLINFFLNRPGRSSPSRVEYSSHYTENAASYCFLRALNILFLAKRKETWRRKREKGFPRFHACVRESGKYNSVILSLHVFFFSLSASDAFSAARGHVRRILLLLILSRVFLPSNFWEIKVSGNFKCDPSSTGKRSGNFLIGITVAAG